MRKIVRIIILYFIYCTANAQWQPLFNGKDFSGWLVYVGIPHSSTEGINLPKNSKGQYTEAFGVGNDPLGVFQVTVEDGAPAILVSGQVFGTLISKKEYGNYHLKLQYKWGEKKWPPRMTMVRDAGLLYHGHGNPGATNGSWHPAQECQIQEGDTGDYWPTGPVTIDIPALKPDSSQWWFYKDDAPLRTQVFSDKMPERRVITTLEKEKPHGEWNTVELITYGDSSIHVVNGKVVMRLYHSKKVKEDGTLESLRSGNIALQSEGAEVFYRNVQIKPIARIPRRFKE